MQHLPFLPQTPVPFLGGPVYKGEGLEAFVKNYGWSQHRLKFGTDPDGDPEKVAADNLENKADRSRLAFLQSCFNIATIIEFLKIGGVDASHKTFCPHGTEIDTIELPRLINEMAIRLSGVQWVATGDETRRVYSILRFTCSCMPPVFPETTDAIFVPMLCMYDTIFLISDEVGIYSESSDISKDIHTESRPTKQMIEAGWCPPSALRTGVLGYDDSPSIC